MSNNPLFTSLVRSIQLSQIRKTLTLFCLVLGLFSLVFSPFLLSVSMFGIVVLAILDISKEGRVVWSNAFRNNWMDFFKHPSYWAYILVFIPIFYSGLYSDDVSYWLERVRIKLPFLGLPLAYFLLPKLSQKEFRGIALFYVGLMALTAVGVLINYFLYFEEINGMIGRGQNIPVPRNHIRFSLGIAIAMLLSLALAFDDKPFGKRSKRFFLAVGVFLFVFQHILAVRSGLVGLYIGIAIFVFYALWTKKYRILGGISIVSIILIVFISMQNIPSLRTKIGYMKYDWQMRKEGKGNNYSDSGRILSIQLALKIGQDNPIIGVGAGDIKNEMTSLLKEQQNNQSLLPHNEYLFYFAATGFIGLAFFIMGVLIPVFTHKNVLFLSIQSVLLFSFLVEATLETSTGAGYFLLWSLLGLLYVNKQK